MRIDCSSTANKGDLLALLWMLSVIAILYASGFIYMSGYEFDAGFVLGISAMKINDWVMRPIERMMNRLWK